MCISTSQQLTNATLRCELPTMPNDNKNVSLFVTAQPLPSNVTLDVRFG